MFDIQFSTHAKKDLAKLPKPLQKRIIQKLTFFAGQEDPLLFAKTLTNFSPLTHRFRVGDYRIAFYIENETISIEKIAHRKEVYLT